MITKKLKSLAVVLACIMTLGTMPPSTGSGNFLPVTTTVEAATKTINLKASNKKVYVGKTTKISAKATKGARLSYKTSNKKIATVNSKGVIKEEGRYRKDHHHSEKIKIQDGKKDYYSKGVPPEAEDYCIKCKTDNGPEKESGCKGPYKAGL